MKGAVEMPSERPSETSRTTSARHPTRWDGAPASPAPRVGDFVADGAVSVPPWFTSAQALAVLRLKARSFVLVSGPGRGSGRVASRDRLAAAAPDQSVSGSSQLLGPAVTPLTTVAEALRMMDVAASDHAAVVVGGVVVGILSRAEAARIMAAPAAGRYVDAPSDTARESDRRGGARPFRTTVGVEHAGHVAHEDLAERCQVEPAGVQVQSQQTVALQAA